MPASCPIKKYEQQKRWLASPKGRLAKDKKNAKQREQYLAGKPMAVAVQPLANALANWVVK